MSTINTSLSLNSTTTFPPVAVVVPKSFDTQNNTFGKIKVRGEYLLGDPLIFLSNQLTICGTQGAYVYAKAPATNPDGVGVELWGAEEIFYGGYYSQPFATLYPGDIALIPLAPNQFTLAAYTTTGEECTLEYSFSSRGLPFGENEIIAVVAGNLWQFYLLDANLGKSTQLTDTGINANDYPNVDDFFYIQDKGYVAIFRSNTNTYILAQVDTHGYCIATGSFNDYNSYWTGGDDEQVASSVVIQYDNGVDYNNLFVCTGEGFWDLNFPEYESDIDLDDNYNGVSSDGSVLCVGNRIGETIWDIFIINKGAKHIIYTYDETVENEPDIIFGTQDSNTAIIIPKSSDDGQVLGIKVFDTNGNLLNENMFNSDLHNSGLYRDSVYDYARGKVLIALYDNIQWYFINYDPLTNTLIGGDLSWRYTRSIYSSCQVYNYSTYAYGEDGDFHAESVRINLYTSVFQGYHNGNYFYGPATYNSFAFTYVIPGMTEPGFYELWDGVNSEELPYICYGDVEEGGTRNRIAILYTLASDGGVLKQLTLTPTEQIVDTIVTDLNAYYYFEFRHFNDDYSMYNFYQHVGLTTEKYIIHKLGAGKPNNIVENVTYPINTSYYLSYGLMLVAQLNTGKLFYFNGSTNKLTLFLTSTQICEDINNEDWQYAMRIRNKHMNSYVPEDIAGESNVLLNPYTGLLYHLNNNALLSTSTTPLPSPQGSWYVGIGNNTYVYLYWNGLTYTINVYDLSFNLIRSVDTRYDENDNSPGTYIEKDSYYNTYNGICNNRVMINMYKNVPFRGQDNYINFYKMISSTGAVQEVQTPDSEYSNYVVNDQYFQAPAP
jgi:hypothetical protein